MIVVLAVLVLLASLVLFTGRPAQEAPTLPFEEAFVTIQDTKPTVHFGTTTITVEIADTESERHHGLSGRLSLAQGHGMLFIFPTSNEYAFWMPDMYFAIDMIWLNDAKRVVYIKENATPDSYPETFAPNMPARFVLEVPAGYAKAHGIVVGSQGSWSD